MSTMKKFLADFSLNDIKALAHAAAATAVADSVVRGLPVTTLVNGKVVQLMPDDPLIAFKAREITHYIGSAVSGPTDRRPRLNVFAGPNGAGKSTLVNYLKTQDIELDVAINADDMARDIANYKNEIQPSLPTQWEAAHAAENKRLSLLNQGASLTTETVMSDRRWLTFFEKACRAGYYIALYVVTTSDPAINIARVADRVAKGGHAVEPEKIVSRYFKVMNDVLPDILKMVNEAIVFDNSDANNGLQVTLTLQNGVLEPNAPECELPDWAKKLLLFFY